MAQHVLTWWQNLAIDSEPPHNSDLNEAMKIPGAKVIHVATSAVYSHTEGTWCWNLLVIEVPDKHPR